jgi:hypothetical protein
MSILFLHWILSLKFEDFSNRAIVLQLIIIIYSLLSLSIQIQILCHNHCKKSFIKKNCKGAF